MPGIRQQNRRRRIGLSRFAPLLSGGAKAGAAAVLAAALFASSPYTNEAGAIDIRGSAVNASLVFPPTYLAEPYGTTSFAHAYADLCAWNLTSETVDVIFKIEDLFTGTVVREEPAQILPHRYNCAGTGGPGESSKLIGASIVFNAPARCSQATEYPGKCRVVASMQVYDSFTLAPPAPMNRVQVDPVFVPGSPGISPLQRLPQ